LLTHNVNQVLNISYILLYNSRAKLSSNNNKQFLIQQLTWMGISIAISLTISMLLPFPISLVAIIGIFIMLNFYLRKRMMKTNGMGMGIFGTDVIFLIHLRRNLLKLLLYELWNKAQKKCMSQIRLKDEKGRIMICTCNILEYRDIMICNICF
jgi:hypothetical protein